MEVFKTALIRVRGSNSILKKIFNNSQPTLREFYYLVKAYDLNPRMISPTEVALSREGYNPEVKIPKKGLDMQLGKGAVNRIKKFLIEVEITP